MWSVWPKTVQLYLSRSLNLFQPARGNVRVLSTASTLPQLLKETEADIGKGGQMRVHFSAGYCPVLAIRYPKGMVSFSDRMTFAHSVGASHLGLASEDVLCEIDALQPALAAFLPLALWTSLQQWAKERRITLSSVRPLWSIATQCYPSRDQGKIGLILQEPDSLSVFRIEEASGTFQALTRSLEEDEPANMESQRQEMLDSLQLLPEQVVQLRFGIASKATLPEGLRAWPSYWQLS